MSQTAHAGRFNLRASGLSERFTFVRELGVGSTGVVIEVVDRMLTDQHLALKILHRHLLIDARIAGRFRNEVLLIRQLSHPNIIRFYDFEELSGKAVYLTMELVRGSSLRTLLSRQIFDDRSADQIVDILRQLAAGLQFAHSRLVIHRDLTPENILIDSAGRVKIADFGLASALDVSCGLTQTGDTVGSPAYMAPEQFSGGTLSPCADLYALGIVVFEMLAGRVPYANESYYLLAKEHAGAPFPLELLKRSAAPAWLAELVERLTAKSPQDRPQSAEEVLEIIEREAGPAQPAQVKLGAAAYRVWQDQHRQRIPAAHRVFAHCFWFAAVFFCLIFAYSFPGSQRNAVAGRMLLELYFNRQLPMLHYVTPSPGVSLLDPQSISTAIGVTDDIAVSAWCNMGILSIRTDPKGNSFAHWIASKPELLSAGETCLVARIYDRQNNDGESPVAVAARAGLARSAERLIALGFTTHHRDVSGLNALHIAINSQNPLLINVFRHADLQSVNLTAEGVSALGLAVQTQDLKTVNAVLALGIDPNQRDREGRTALMIAAGLKGPGAGEIIEALVKAGCDVRARDNSGKNFDDYKSLS